jgi:hypothetical protein
MVTSVPDPERQTPSASSRTRNPRTAGNGVPVHSSNAVTGFWNVRKPDSVDIERTPRGLMALPGTFARKETRRLLFATDDMKETATGLERFVQIDDGP